MHVDILTVISKTVLSFNKNDPWYMTRVMGTRNGRCTESVDKNVIGSLAKCIKFLIDSKNIK